MTETFSIQFQVLGSQQRFMPARPQFRAPHDGTATGTPRRLLSFFPCPRMVRRTRYTRVDKGYGWTGFWRGGAGSEQVLFDRVICEPPCSLDGTLREKPDLWASWTVGLGLASHNALFKLLLRSLHNLAPGGKLLYTVRSLNPIEAEAVVLGAMKRFKYEHTRVLTPRNKDYLNSCPTM